MRQKPEHGRQDPRDRGEPAEHAQQTHPAEMLADLGDGFLEDPDLGDGLAVGFLVDPGSPEQLLERLFRVPAETLPQVVPILPDGFVDRFVIRHQNILLLACALISAEVENGIRVVYPARAATICFTGHAKTSRFQIATVSL